MSSRSKIWKWHQPPNIFVVVLGVVIGVTVCGTLISWATGFLLYTLTPGLGGSVYVFGYPIAWRYVSFYGEDLLWSEFVVNSIFWITLSFGGIDIGVIFWKIFEERSKR